MTVLLSGSHGLVGTALAADLAAGGVTVVRLVRDTAGRGAGEQGGGQPTTVGWDPRRGAVDHHALRRHGPYSAVVHLAGAGIGDRRWTPRRRQELVDSRVGPTRHLAGIVRALDPVPGVLVSASAVGYYGDRGDEVLTEESARGEGFLSDLCRDWEQAAATAAGDLRVVQLRSGVVLDARGGALAKQLPIFRLGLGGRLGDGRQYTSWISLADEVGVIRRAIDDDRLVGPLDATAPSPVTNAELTRALGRALHRPAVLPVPRAALAVALGAEMSRETVLASQRVLPARLAAVGHEFAHPDVDAALASALAAGG